MLDLCAEAVRMASGYLVFLLYSMHRVACRRCEVVLVEEVPWVMRKSCGFRTFRVLELALYHSHGKLPEPESTHDFF